MYEAAEEGYETSDEKEDIVGTRKLPRQRCLDMHWSNSKEITAWEIAWCIHNHDGIDIRTKQLSEERRASVQKQLDILEKSADREQVLDTLAQKKNELEAQYDELDLTSCQNLPQVKCVKDLIENQYFNELSDYVNSDFAQRNTKRYNEDLKSYNDHLKYALHIHRQYNQNFQDPEAVENVEYFFQKLIDLGLPKPFTKKEIKTDIFENRCQSLLEKTGLDPTPAKKLSKQITKIHFTR